MSENILGLVMYLLSILVAQGRTLQIHLLCVLAAGLHKDGVPVLARKAHHLILNGGAVPGTNSFAHAAIELSLIHIWS